MRRRAVRLAYIIAMLSTSLAGCAPANSFYSLASASVGSVYASTAASVDSLYASTISKVALLNPWRSRDAEYCPRGSAPISTVKTFLPEPKIDNTLTTDQIGDRVRVDYSVMTFGATEGQLTVIAVDNVRVEPSKAGGICAYPTQVSVTIALTGRMIHVASEFYEAEPCVYDEILSHEERHVALDNQLLHDAAGTLTANMSNQLIQAEGVWGKDETTARESLQKHLTTYQATLQMSIQAIRRDAHAREIDTSDERHRLFAACNRRLAQLYPEFR